MSANPILEKIIYLAEISYSASQISILLKKEFGVDKSRNSIIGICHRKGIKLHSNIKNRPKIEGIKIPRPRKFNDIINKASKALEKSKPVNPDTIVPIILEPTGKHISELGEKECSWPLNVSEQVYCGLPVVRSKDRLNIWSSYCQVHHTSSHRK